MTKTKAFITSVCLIGTSAFAETAGQSIQVIEASDGYSFATVSLKDLSRIHCPNGISNIVFSKEKEIQVDPAKNGKDAYVKILPRRTTGDGVEERFDYGQHPRDIFIECNDRTFSLVLVPKDIPAQTVILKAPYSESKKASEFERANPYDSTMLDLVKKAYLGDVPDGYEPMHVGKEVKDFEEIKLVLMRSYVGAKYSVHEYTVDAKKSVNLYEAMFIPYLKNPLAISIVKTILEPTENTRMFVVTLNQEEAGGADAQ